MDRTGHIHTLLNQFPVTRSQRTLDLNRALCLQDGSRGPLLPIQTYFLMYFNQTSTSFNSRVMFVSSVIHRMIEHTELEPDQINMELTVDMYFIIGLQYFTMYYCVFPPPIFCIINLNILSY